MEHVPRSWDANVAFSCSRVNSCKRNLKFVVDSCRLYVCTYLYNLVSRLALLVVVVVYFSILVQSTWGAASFSDAEWGQWLAQPDLRRRCRSKFSIVKSSRAKASPIEKVRWVTWLPSRKKLGKAGKSHRLAYGLWLAVWLVWFPGAIWRLGGLLRRTTLLWLVWWRILRILISSDQIKQVLQGSFMVRRH